MTETQKRIQAYKKALPGMKERVSAVAMLLIVSISMMTSATFAWVTLSRNPEISSIATTVTTNGNLEIALSGKKGLEPADTTVVDGGQDVTRSNLTWGNLINLSDESYNLSGISLRPASLNINKLATSPVYSTQYSNDGRVEDFITDFAFTSYDTSLKQYAVPKDTAYGVRGVSSVTYKQVTGNLFLVNQLDTIYKGYTQACTDFKILYSNEGYMKVVYRLVQEYANVALDRDGYVRQDISGDMDTLMDMMNDLVAVVEKIGTTYAEMANLTYYQTLTNAADYDPYDLQDVIGNTIPGKYINHLTYYSSFRTLYNNTKNAYDGLNAAAVQAEQGTPVYWDDIEGEANILCNMAKAEINGYTVSKLKAAIKENLMFGLTVAGWDNVPAVIHEGVLKDVDQFLAGDFYVESNPNLEVAVSYMGVNIELHPYVYTAAYQSGNSYTVADYNATETAASGGTNIKGDPVAAETYAMAIDFWVRTNEQNALLILEGDVITRDDPVLIELEDGTTTELYTYKYTNSDDEVVELEVYKLTEDGTDVWYLKDTQQLLTDVVGTVEVTETNPELKTQEVIVGYEGVNRVWDELDDDNNAAVMLPAGTTSATQGSGSCYVFYPETPEDMEQGLHLLSAMRIAFVDDNGGLLGQAYMDLEDTFFDSGRVIIPLRLYANKPIEIEEGITETNYITRLTQNEAMRITALIYLEGTGLENSDVLSAGSITGQMNIQFGTNILELDPMDLPDMKDDAYKITRVEPKGATSDSPLILEEEPWEIELKMLIEGIEPSTVKGNFISVINATQGARQPEFELFSSEDTPGMYTAKMSFTAPGNYQLRSLQIDGVDHALSAEDIVYVKVPGMKISSLTWDDDNASNDLTVLTAESYVDRMLSLSLGSSEVHSVQGVFLGDNGKNVTVDFTSTDGVNYSGKGTFAASGIYKMTYLYIDGVITALDSTQYKTIDASLGLNAAIRLTKPYFADGVKEEDQNRILDPDALTFAPGVGYSFVYTGEETLYFDITCTVSDDQGNPVGELGKVVRLNYGQGTTQNALSEILDWNGSAYTGTFDFKKFGIFQFNHLVIDDVNFITKGTAHSITSIPAAFMEYVGNDLPENGLVFDLGGTRTVSLKLANASAATVKLSVNSPTYNDGKDVILTSVATSTETAFVNGEETEVSTFTFTLPDDGEWTITDVKAGTVFYNDVFYDGSDAEGATGWLDMLGGDTPVIPADEKLSAEFVTKVSVLVSQNDTIDLGSGSIGTNFALGENQKITLSFKAYDGADIWTHAARAGKTVTVSTAETGSYVWHENTVGASSQPANVSIEGVETPLTETAPTLTLNVGYFTVDGVYSLLEALKVEITVSDSATNEVINTLEKEVSTLPNVKVTWTAPTVTITKTTPNTTVNAYVSHTRSGFLNRNVNITTTTYAAGIVDENRTANVCYRASKADYGLASFCNLTQPTVTITLSGFGNASGATLSFGSSAHVYAANGGDTITQYTWTGNGACTRYIGLFTSVSGGDDGRTIAGTITANQLVINDSSGNAYTFTIPTITINNPY